jgi:hypothetical protein
MAVHEAQAALNTYYYVFRAACESLCSKAVVSSTKQIVVVSGTKPMVVVSGTKHMLTWSTR